MEEVPREGVRGRGVAENPANRFTRLSVVPDEEARDPDDPGPRTLFFRDASRSIISHNDSPDVGFTHSLNPYRGCEHGCTYCVGGDTLVLTTDGAPRRVAELRLGDGIYGTVGRGRDRRYVRTRVLAHWSTTRPGYRITLGSGTELIASGDHRFLARGGWRYVAAEPDGGTGRLHLAPGDRLMGTGALDGPRGLAGQPVRAPDGLRVVSVEPLGKSLPLFDITTGTGDFIANGVVSHNCYARPTHEYLGFSSGLDFETRIMVKEDAPELLRRELSSRRWKPTPISMSGVTDPYQPVERRLRVTRRCLEVLAEFRNPVAIVTKGNLVTRDADLLGELARHGAAAVFLSITSLDPELQRRLEPRASSPARRLDALAKLSAAGIPVGVLVAPTIPGLNDHELPAILRAAAAAGARAAGFIPLRLPHGNAELFEGWLETHFPERKGKVLGRIREIRGGRLNDARFGARMRGEGEYAEQLRALFHVTCRRLGLNRERLELSTAAFRRPDPTGQLGLFE